VPYTDKDKNTPARLRVPPLTKMSQHCVAAVGTRVPLAALLLRFGLTGGNVAARIASIDLQYQP
jgi:hypothetical protein